MSPTPAQYSLRAANRADRPDIQRFTQSLAYTHRHLDWRDPLEWLGRQPFWIMEKNGEMKAVLACIVEPDEVAWVRLFAVDHHLSPAWAWNILFERVYADLKDLPGRPLIAVLGLQDWFSDMLVANKFKLFQEILVLSFETTPPPDLPPDPALHIRKMRLEDLPEVVRIDNLAFESLWRLSDQDLARAFERSNYKTVLERRGKIAGYQMSAHNGFNAHLSRLAVDPVLQRMQLGSRLVRDVLHQFINQNSAWGVTLNTQNNNYASLALYQKIGFHLTGESFPVYVYPYHT